MKSEEMKTLIKRRDYLREKLKETTKVYNIMLRDITKETALLEAAEDQIAALEAKEA